MDFQNLRYEKEGHVVTLTLDRPERLHALNQDLIHREIPGAIRDAGEDPEVRAVIVTATGDRAFCAGADMKDTAETGTIGGSTVGSDYVGSPTSCLHEGFDKPVIVAVNGMCLGAGLHFLADGDLILAADHATFFDTHVRIGQVFALETIGLIRKIPFGEVMRMMLLSGTERMSAQRALELGLVSEVVPGPDLASRARTVAETIAAFSPATIAASKRAMWSSLEHGLSDALARGWKEIYEHWSHPDSKEGPRAYAAGRKPRWSVD